jgi:predicted kinase
MKKPTIHLIHGFIGFGKTTFAKKLEKEVNAIRFTHDEWLHHFYGPEDSKDFYEKSDKIHSFMEKMEDKLLKLGQSVIIDSGAWSKKGRNKIRQKAKKFGANFILYSIDCPIETALKRTVYRTKDTPKDSMHISKKVFQELLKKFEPLEKDEKHILIKQSYIKPNKT